MAAKKRRLTPSKLAGKLKRQVETKNEDFKTKVPYPGMVAFVFAVNIFFTALLLLGKGYLPPKIPLFYGLPEGSQQLADSAFIFLPTLFSVLTLIANSVFAFFLKDQFVKKVLVASAMSISFLSIVTTTKIFFLVGAI